MGLSGSKTTTGPSKQALPHLQSASNTVQGAYNANQGNLDTISSGLTDMFEDYRAGMDNDPTMTAANTRVQDVLGGKYLNGNPQMDAIISQTNDSVADRVNALFSKSGQTGSSRQIGELGKQLSDAEARIRYQNYGDEQARIDAAVGQAAGLNTQKNANVATAAGLGESAATLPYVGADFLAKNLGGLWGNSTTTTQKQGLGTSLLGLGGAALGGWASGGFG